MDTAPFPLTVLSSDSGIHLTTTVSPGRGVFTINFIAGICRGNLERLSQVLATQASLELVSSASSMLQTGILAVSVSTLFNKIFFRAIFWSW